MPYPPLRDSIDAGTAFSVINLRAPSVSTDAATKAYVDAAIAGAMTLASDPTGTLPVAAGAAAAAIHTGSGYVSGVCITATGSAGMTITDGSGGTIIAIMKPGDLVGWIPFPHPVKYNTSIYVNSGTNTPAVTVSYV